METIEFLRMVLFVSLWYEFLDQSCEYRLLTSLKNMNSALHIKSKYRIQFRSEIYLRSLILDHYNATLNEKHFLKFGLKIQVEYEIRFGLVWLSNV